MGRFSVEPLQSVKRRGIEYTVVKRFKDKKKAESYCKELEKTSKSKRVKPIIDRVSIGLYLGYVYRVCIPKKMEDNI